VDYILSFVDPEPSFGNDLVAGALFLLSGVLLALGVHFLRQEHYVSDYAAGKDVCEVTSWRLVRGCQGGRKSIL